jgi:hypothetical protein
MSSKLPSEWVTKRPIETYDTQFFYIGLSRYDTKKKVLSNIIRKDNGKTVYIETPTNDTVFARGYISEFATITVYSHSPRVWVEDMGINDIQAFVQQPTQVA